MRWCLLVSLWLALAGGAAEGVTVLKHKAAAGAPPVRTGTPTSQQLSGANTGSVSVTVAADATLLWCVVTGYPAAGTLNFFSSAPAVTIGGQAMTAIAGGDSANLFMQAAFYRFTPPTGSQTFAWDWVGTGVVSWQVMLICAQYKSVDTSGPRSTSCTQVGSGARATATLTAQTNDLLIATATTYIDSQATFTWANATEITEFTAVTGEHADAAHAEASPTGNQTVSATPSPDNDGGICAMVLKPAP